MSDNTQAELREQMLQDIYNAALWREQVGATQGKAEFGDKDRHLNRLEGSNRVADLILAKVTAYTNKQIEEVLDRLESKAFYDPSGTSPLINPREIQAERNKLEAEL